MVFCRAAPGLDEENRFVPSWSMAEICFEPIDKTLAIMNVPRFYGPLDTMRIAIRAGRKCGRQPALLSQKCHRRKMVLFITHDDDVPRRHSRDEDHAHRMRHPRAGRRRAPCEVPRQSQGAYAR